MDNKKNKTGKVGIIGTGIEGKNIAALATLLALKSNSRSFFETMFNDPSFQPDENDLKKGFRLVPLEVEKNTLQYSHLYKDGVKISDHVFRRGGLSSGYENGDYCSLIVYPNYGKGDSYERSNHCLVDLNGKIVLQVKEFDSVYFIGGVLASTKDGIHNLLTGKIIVKGNTTMKTKNFYFVECNYDKSFENGVYKIEMSTGNYEIFQ